MVVALVVELRLFAPGRRPTEREAVVWSIGWLGVAGLVIVGLAVAGGPVGAWSTVYLIERSLSLDNVFLFALLLTYFAVPSEHRQRVLAIGIVGALVLRGIAIVAGLAVIERAEAVVYVFGALLLFVAYRSFRGAGEESDPARNPAVRLFRRLVRTTDGFRGRRLLVRERGTLYATPLLLAVLAMIVADIAFAVDSIPAALAVTRNAGVIWTANAFALLGMGALLALVDILARRFRYLNRTIAVVLAFVGLKILLEDVVHVGDVASLAIIVGLLAAGIVVSLVADRVDPPAPAEEAARRPPRCPERLTPPQPEGAGRA